MVHSTTYHGDGEHTYRLQKSLEEFASLHRISHFQVRRAHLVGCVTLNLNLMREEYRNSAYVDGWRVDKL